MCYLCYQTLRPAYVLLMLLLGSAFVLAQSIASYPEARGRVRILHGSVVSDRGTLLIGPYIATAHKTPPPSQEEFNALKLQGCNAVHVYAGSHVDKNPANEAVAETDLAVERTAKAGLYCVITIGCDNDNVNFDQNPDRWLQHTLAFWKFYAERYKDCTHVVYEIKNEPASAAPLSDTCLLMYQLCYDIIRAHAPKTHVVLFSYGGNTHLDWEGIAKDLARLQHIDWSNASIGFHGYDMGGTLLKKRVTAWKTHGYPLFDTEVPEMGWDTHQYTRKISPDYTKALLDNQVSCLAFVSCRSCLRNANWKEPIDENYLTWTPDYGDWPEPPAARVAIRRIQRASSPQAAKSAAKSRRMPLIDPMPPGPHRC